MRPLNNFEIEIVKAFPGSQYGKVILALLEEEIREMEEDFDLNAKVSNDPINQDWRFKRGEIWGLKRAVNLPRRYINNQQS